MGTEKAELLKALARLRDQYGELFDDLIRQIVSKRVRLPDLKGSGRPKVLSEFILGYVWKRVEFQRQFHGEKISNACQTVAVDGGFTFTGTIEKELQKPATIRRRYYEARELLAKDPIVEARWKNALSIDLEAARTGRSVAEVTGQRRPDWQQEFLNREKAERK